MKWALKHKNQHIGFTVVELLIVIVVIGILAAVTIVSYNGVTNRAKALAVTNSLKHASEEVQLNMLEGQVLTQLPSTITPDKDVVLSLAGSKSGTKEYCINAYRITPPVEMKSYDSANREIRPYLCPGVLIGSPLGGSIPDVPIGVNMVADFSQWELTGGVTYNQATQELEFSGATGKATSPLVRATGTTGMSFRYDLFSATSAPNQNPNAGAYSGSAYFAANGTTPALNSSGYQTNGNAQSVPVNTWTTRTWGTATGTNVQYIQFNINLAPTTWTSNNFKVRNPSVFR